MWHNLGRLLRYRGLIQSLVARELKARYRGSMLGYFWSFVNPLLLLLIYSFVFTYLLENRSKDIQPYAVFMFTGLLPWTWFSSSLNEATGSLISGGNLIKKVLFPAEVLPIVTILSNMVHFLLGLPILIGFMAWYQIVPDWPQLPWFLVIVAVQLLFTAALGLLLSALAVHFRDVRDLVQNLLTFWFFATPIIYWYGEEQFADYKLYFDLNPFSHLAISYQEILFFSGGFGHWVSANANVRRLP
jgi:ABC-type polysaccharide/polyol phosphate export permease